MADEREPQDASDLNPDRTMTVEGREYRERLGKAIGAALRQCGIRVQYALAGPSELWDVADLVIQSMPSTRGVPSRETVAPTEEQIAETIAQHRWRIQRDDKHNDTGGVDCSCGEWSAPHDGKRRPIDAWAAHQAGAVLALTVEGSEPSGKNGGERAGRVGRERIDVAPVTPAGLVEAAHAADGTRCAWCDTPAIRSRRIEPNYGDYYPACADHPVWAASE